MAPLLLAAALLLALSACSAVEAGATDAGGAAPGGSAGAGGTAGDGGGGGTGGTSGSAGDGGSGGSAGYSGAAGSGGSGGIGGSGGTGGTGGISGSGGSGGSLAPCPAEEHFDPAVELILGATFEDAFLRCHSAARFAVVASEMELRLTVTGLGPGGRVELAEGPNTLLDLAYDSGSGIDLTFTTTRSGELAIRLRPPDPWGPPPAFTGRLECLSGCDREATRYPIVLIHGMAGTDRYLGLLDYYYGVPAHLAGRGYLVFAPVLPLVGPSDVRAPILAAQLEDILAETGATKLHLVGHSQGGLDMRVLVSGLGWQDRVASMTTVATPHGGLRLEIPAFLSGMDFREAYLTGEFARLYPDVEAIPRFSWAGRTCGVLERTCRQEMNGEVVEVMLVASMWSVRGAHRDDASGGANDGLVPVESAKWGTFLGVIPADHWDEVGQLADGPGGPFDHLEFYLSEARRLRALEVP